MPDKKISELNTSGTLTGAEQIPLVQSGSTFKTLLSTISNYVKSTITNFVPYSGATSDVDLGEFGIQLGNLEFDNTPTNIPTNAGSLIWNDTDGTLDLKLKGGNVTLQVGQETVIRVVNKTATNVTLLQSNYQAVRITGAQGQRPKVDLAQATNDILSAETIGLVTETIANNQEGFINTSGLVRNINTTGSLQGETWLDGDILYLSPTTAGNVTNIKPIAPNHLIIIGYVISAHITQGTIFVKVDNGYELDELHNVSINSLTLANNDVLTYESSSQLWKNKQESAKVIYKDLTSSAVLTGTTNISILKSCLILANTVSVDDEIQITARAYRTTNTGVSTQYLYYNTTNSLTGATEIGIASGAASWISIIRNLFIKSSTNSETSGGLNSGNSDGVILASTSFYSLNIDWTQDVYIIQAFQNAAVGNNTTSRGIIIKRFR